MSLAVYAQKKPCQVARHAKIPQIYSLTYHKARKLLLASGWQPLQTKSHNQATDDPDIAYGNGQEFWGKGYIEIEACAGTGLAPCAFLFRDVYGNKLRVTTSGEEDSKSKIFAKISGWQFVCK